MLPESHTNEDEWALKHLSLSEDMSVDEMKAFCEQWRISYSVDSQVHFEQFERTERFTILLCYENAADGFPHESVEHDGSDLRETFRRALWRIISDCTYELVRDARWRSLKTRANSATPYKRKLPYPDESPIPWHCPTVPYRPGEA